MVLEKPFEPYVTNKSQGSGLGLAICRKIVLNTTAGSQLPTARRRCQVIRIHLPLATCR